MIINGENLNEQIVDNGHGRVYKKYCKTDYCNDWLKLEETARDAQVGLLEDKNPQPPWAWRAEHIRHELLSFAIIRTFGNY